MTVLGILQRLAPSLVKTATVMHTLLIKKSLWRTFKTGHAIQADAWPIPWITYPAMDYLAQLDFSQAEILECSAGDSSLWWASRACHVISVESGPMWAEWVRSQTSKNLRVIGPISDSDYVSTPLEPGKKFEVIVVDGKQPEACALAVLNHLAEGALLILDNAHWYPQICASLQQRGMLEVDFHGFGPVNDYTLMTCIFIHSSCAVPHRGQMWDPASYGNLVSRT